MDYEKELAERRERDAKTAKAALLKLREIVKELGYEIVPPKHKPEYSLGHFGPQADVTAAHEDRTLSLDVNGWQNENRLKVSVSYPKPEKGEASTYGIETPSITVSMEKTPEQIAADIKRRLLPAYEVELAKVRERNAGTVKYHDIRERALEQVLGRKLTEREIKSGESHFEGVYLGKRSDKYGSTIDAEARADGDGEVSLKFSYLPVDLATKIVSLMRKEAR